MTEKENLLRAIRFEKPEWIPMSFQINAACWHSYDQDALQDLMEAHPLLFPGYKRQDRVIPSLWPNQKKDKPYTDPWGCVWETTEDGITGSVHGHPLSDWSAFEGYRPPDAGKTDGVYPMDWPKLEKDSKTRKAGNQLVLGGLPHGHTFLRLQDIRGYQDLLFDMVDEEPRLEKLIGMVSDFNLEVVRKWMELKPDIMAYAEDLGMQVGPMLSPDQFRRYIKPVYQRIMAPAREQGCIVHMHSDGDIKELVDELIDGGVEAINLQDLVNGIDWIAQKLGGKVCVDLDIDRQQITPRGTPELIDALIKEEVSKIGSKEGGLSMIYGLYPGIPLENVKALMDAMEKYAGFYG